MEIGNQLIDAFVAVVEEGTVRRAAQRLGRTQPAITARLQQLEEQLGVELFARVGRRLELTPVGRLAAAKAREVVDATASFRDVVLLAASEPTGLLRVGALPTLSTFKLAPALPTITRAHRRVHIEVVPGLVESSLASLRAGRVDVVLSVGGDASVDLTQEVIGAIRPVAVFRRDDAPREHTVSPHRLARHPYIAAGRGLNGDPFYDAVARFAARHPFGEDVQLIAPQIQSMKGLVAAGGGFAILPDYTVVEDALVTRPIDGLRWTLPIIFSTSPDTQSENTTRLVKLLHAALTT